MNNKTIKDKIIELQQKNYGDHKIGLELGWTKDKVKHFREKNGIKSLRKECSICGTKIFKRFNQKFCSDECKEYDSIRKIALADAKELLRWKV